MSESAEFYVDEFAQVPPHVADALVARGLVWRTEYRVGGAVHHGTIIAGDRSDAVALARDRRLGELVVSRIKAADAEA